MKIILGDITLSSTDRDDDEIKTELVNIKIGKYSDDSENVNIDLLIRSLEAMKARG